jgi:hypothetical protein
MYLLCPDLMHAMATAPFVASRQDAVRYTAKWYLLRKLFCSAQSGCNGSIDPGSNLSKFNEAVNTTAQGYELAVHALAWRMGLALRFSAQANTIHLLRQSMGPVCWIC